MIRSLVVLILVATSALAQDKKPAKKTPFDNVPGYKVHTLDGFTVVVNEKVLTADTTAYKVKPLDAIERELKNVTSLMSKSFAEKLRRVPVWAEWDERFALGNGRAGAIYGSYFGGHQLALLADGRNPLMKDCVVIHLTKELTRTYSEKERPDALLLLHEMAHAVHDKLLPNDPAITAAYQQAMSRQLYDKSRYCTINDNEFFAEMTCAYLDRLEYFPRTRDDLKKHDPVTFKLMEKVWAKAAADAGKGKTTYRPADGSAAFEMDIPGKKPRYGKQLSGPPTDLADFAGHVTVLAYWRHEQTAELKRLAGWADDLRGYGLRVALLSAYYNQDKNAGEERFSTGGLPFPAFGTTYLPRTNGDRIAESAGHLAVLDVGGKAVFRGSIEDADVFVREAVGAKVFAALGVDREDVPKSLRPATDALLAGEKMPEVLKKFGTLTTSTNATVAGPAKKLADAINAPWTKMLDDAVAGAKAEPAASFIAAEQVAAAFKGTSVGRRADGLVEKWKMSPAVATELRARKELDKAKKLAAAMVAQSNGLDPADPRFRPRNAAALGQLKAVVEQMKAKFPGTKATAEAGGIGREFGL